MEPIYFDNNATTQLDERVRAAMVEELRAPPSNPSSVHFWGRRAKQVLEGARSEIGPMFGFTPSQVVFCSGATEAINTLLHSLPPRGHILTTRIEHSALYETVKAMETKGLQVTYVPVDLWGAPKLEAIEALISSETTALFFSAANGETGVKLDVEGVACLAEKYHLPLFLDGVAWIGKEPWPLSLSGVTALCLSSHKLHGPQGIGALMVNDTYLLSPLMYGGGQEKGKRPGTENLAGVVGMRKALSLWMEEKEGIRDQLKTLKDHFESELKRGFEDILIHGEGPRIANTSQVAFLGVSGESLLIQLDLARIAVSHGSACSSGALEPSRVLRNMGVSHRVALSSLRFSLSRWNSKEEIDRALEILHDLVKKGRSSS